ncbi:MAG: hypothetical protein ABIP38_12875, partial [Steroidobacteraceae bacterium]
MPNTSRPSIQLHTLNGHPAALSIERAIAELRRGRAIYCHGDAAEQGMLAVSVETVLPELLDRLALLAREQHSDLWLALTRQRALTLGLQMDPEAAGVLLRVQGADPQRIAALAGCDGLPLRHVPLPETAACDATGAAMLELARQARLLPALLLLRCAAPAPGSEILQVHPVQLSEVGPGEALDALCVEIISQASVPLAGHENCRVVLFRDARDASEHIAVLIGDADAKRDAGHAVPVRMHSACLT